MEKKSFLGLFFWLQYDFIQVKMHDSQWKRVLFLCFSFPRIYFLQDFFSWDLIFWDFIGSPHTILGKKFPGIQNTGLYFLWHFFQGLEKIRTFFPKFLFPGFFFEKLFFPGLSYIDSPFQPVFSRLNSS